MEYEEKMTEDNTEKDGEEYASGKEAGIERGELEAAGSPGRLFQEVAVLPQALHRSQARQELKLKAS